MRFLLILILIYLAFRILVNIVLPLVLRSVVNKASQNMSGQFNQTYQRQASHRPQGEVRIETPSDQPKHRGNQRNEGEYVDFTEVK
jgi:hypothetical protein